MLAYFFLLSVPMVFSLPAAASKKKWHVFLLASVFLFYLFFVGFRDHVGTDWGNYIGYFYKNLYTTFSEALWGYEPGFALLTWLMIQLGWGIYGLNFFAALVFHIGLFSYAGRCVNPWLAVATVTPFLVVVIAMSASRQSMAIGIFLFMLSRWEKMGAPTKVALVLLASSFHMSAIVLLFFVVYDLTIPKVARYPILAASAGLALVFLPRTEVFGYVQEEYLIQGIHSPGALIHMSLNALPGILYFVFRGRMRELVSPPRVFEVLCFLSIAALPAIVISSTVADRLALYLSAVQMGVLSALPSIAGHRVRSQLVKLAVLGYLALVLFTWLGFSNHAIGHFPYENYLITSGLLGF
ncbi:MAG: EpsG family protein [Acidobacteriota bacterium]